MRLRERLKGLTDRTAWALVVLSILPLALVDRAMLVTLLQWCAFAFALAGLSIGLSRVVLPQVDLSEWLQRARDGTPNAALVVLAVAIVWSAIFCGIVYWARA